MKYMAPVEPRHAVSAWAESLDVDDLGGIQIVELGGAEHGFVRNGSRRWLGVFIAIAAAVTGFGFVSHGSEATLLGPVQTRSEVRAVASASPGNRVGAPATDRTTEALDDQPIVVTSPVEGATITSGVTMTGGVVVIDAAARRPLGRVHAAVSIGELVLGARDVDVETSGTFQFRILLFPPPFDAPVALRMQAAPSGGRAGFDMSRDFHLAIPSAVGFWDASATGLVDAAGRVQMRIRGYGPLSARTVDIAIRDARRQEIATDSVRLTVDGDLPGAVGGRILGLGSFDTTLWLPRGSSGHLTVLVRWRDAATGARLHMETALMPNGE
jgi:hypothetical protein